MKAILEVSFRGVEKTEALQALIREKAEKLEETCSHMVSCRVAVEKRQGHQRSGSPFRVRIALGVPPGHEIVVRREPGEGDLHDDLFKVLREAFEVARRRLQELVGRQRHEVKVHPEQQRMALVIRLFREEGYGFLKTPEGQEIYFHRNSVLRDGFDRLEIGTGVRYVDELGEKGLQATTVEIVDKPGARTSKTEGRALEPPLGWDK
jgi:cold shock CspA family protein/ribosome-associated translation inhibitor RaiA